MPRRRDRKPDGRLETSVCRSHLLSEVQIWEICQTFFDINAPKPAIGRGEGQAETVFKVGLSFDPDGKPYHQHANIVGWPADKPAQKIIAQQLAADSIFRSKR